MPFSFEEKGWDEFTLNGWKDLTELHPTQFLIGNLPY